MSQPTQRTHKIKESVQYIQNKSFDEDFDVLVVEPLEYSPDNVLKRKITDSLAIIVDEADSTTTYVGEAPIGTATSTAKWRIKKITVSGTQTKIEYADGDDNFDNVWDSRTSLSYS